MIHSFHGTQDFTQGLRDGRDELRDADPPVEASGREANQASNRAARMCEERETATHHQSGGEEIWDGGPY
jgi:hypothetical protein